MMAELRTTKRSAASENEIHSGENVEVSSGGEPQNSGGQQGSDYKTAGEYAEAVNGWLQQCYYWHFMASNFPYFAMHQMLHQHQSSFLGQSTNYRNDQTRENLQAPPANQLDQIRSLYARWRLNNARQLRFGDLPTPAFVAGLTNNRGREFRIPPAWKRFLAEIVDFSILFLLKLFITFIAMDFFDMIDLDKFDDPFKDGFHYKFALQITSDIFILELIHRVLVCFYEALCLHQGTNGVGGSTPGKNLLGLRVVSCEGIQPLQGNRVLVYPAGDIGFGWALLRSVIKNFTMALLFPTCITMFYFPFQRTVYDILCGCIVVEDIRPMPVH